MHGYGIVACIIYSKAFNVARHVQAIWLIKYFTAIALAIYCDIANNYWFTKTICCRFIINFIHNLNSVTKDAATTTYLTMHGFGYNMHITSNI